MGKFKYTLSSIWFWFVIVINCFFIENVPLLSTPASTGGFNNWIFSLLSGIIVLMLFIYYFFEHRNNKMKIDFILLPIFIIVLGCGLFAIWNNPTNQVFTHSETLTSYTFNISLLEKIRYSFSFSISIIVLYSVFFPLGRRILRTRLLHWIYYIFLLVIITSITFSFIKEWNVYQSFFDGSFTDTSVCSFYLNPNTYGFALFLGILCCMVLNFYKHRWWLYLLMISFFVIMLFTLCNATLIVSSIALTIYFIGTFIYQFYLKHYFRGVFVCSLLLLLPVVFVLLFMFGIKYELPYVVSLNNVLKEHIFINNFDTFSNRTDIWKGVISLLKTSPLKILFGYGYGVSSKLITFYSSFALPHVLHSCHSAYYEVLLFGGIIGILIYLIGILYYIYCLIRLLINKQVRYSLLYLMFLLLMLAHNFVESTRFFDVSTSGMLIMVMVYLPPIFSFKHRLHSPSVNEITKVQDTSRVVTPYSALKAISLVLVCLLVIVPINLIFDFSLTSKFTNIILITEVFVLSSLLFYPYLFYLVYKNGQGMKNIIHIIIITSLVLLFAVVPYPLLLNVLHLSNRLLMIICPSIYIGFGILLTVIYMFIKKSGPIKWIRLTCHSIFITPGLAPIFTIIIFATLVVLSKVLLPVDYLLMIVLSILSIIIYFIIFMLFPFNDVKRLGEQFNQLGLKRLNKHATKEVI